MASAAGYVCSLDAASVKKARKELGEEAREREGAVTALRTWLQETDTLHFTTDTHILLQFLRASKFSQLRARDMITNYVTMKTQLPAWFDAMDPASEDLLHYMRAGAVLELPGTTSNGEKVVLWRYAALTPGYWEPRSHAAAARAMLTQWMMHFYPEHAQVHGLVYVVDFSGLALYHVRFHPLEALRAAVKALARTVPNRYKVFYCYGGGALFGTLLDMGKPFLGAKVKDRIKILGNNLEDVYKVVAMENLPEEYLPDDYEGPSAGSIQSIIDKQIQRIQTPQMVQYFEDISNPKWKIANKKNKKTRDVGGAVDSAPSCSFRKLNID